MPDKKVPEAIWVQQFNEEKALAFCKDLFKASEERAKDQPIIIYIDSYGGQVDALTTMLSAMGTVPNDIITVCMGKAMSCGAILLSSGDKRFISPHGRVMIHELSSMNDGNVQDVLNHAGELERLNRKLMGLLAKNCKMTLNQLSKHFTNERRDLYLTPTQAKKFGIVDAIGVPKLHEVTKYEVLV
jgi:ATP-dependent Clp protease protease subunit